MALPTVLVVISLATALKDIVEVAQEIRESFSKLPQNYRNSLALATEIAKSCEKMRKIYGDKEDIFDRTPDLHESLKELYQEMVSVHEQCIRLVPPISEKKMQRFKMVFYSFMNRKKVSSLILGLKDHVNDCYKQFLLLSNIRIEATVNQIACALSTVAKNPSPVLNSIGTIAVCGSGEAQLSEFIHPSPYSGPSLRDTIPKYELWKAFLRQEIESVENLLARLVSRWARSPPADSSVIVQAFTTRQTNLTDLTDLTVMETVSQRNLISDVFRLQMILEDTDNTIISTFGNSVASVSSRLTNKRLHADSLTVRKLGVQLWGQLVLIYPSRDVRIVLLQHLTNLSICYYNIGDNKQAYATCQKSIDNILEQLTFEESHILRELLARNLALQASSNKLSPNSAYELASRAVGTLEHVLHIQDSTQIEDSFVSSRNHDSFYTYSEALLFLSAHQETRGSLAESLITRKRALQVVSGLAKVYPSSRRILERKAEILQILFGYKYSSHNSLEEIWAYGEECVMIFERLLHGSGSLFDLNSLTGSLLTLQQTFQIAGRLENMGTVHHRITSFSESAAKRFPDLQTVPSDSGANYYYNLALSHDLVQRIQEAIQAVRISVSQYSTLDSFNRNDRHRLRHIDALCLLSELLSKSGQYELAIFEGYKAIKMVENVTGQQESLLSVNAHLQVVENIMNALENMPPGTLVLQQTAEMMKHFTTIFTHPLGKTIAVRTKIPAMYIVILEKNGMFDSAIKYSEKFFATWEDMPDYCASSDAVYPYLQCFEALAKLLKRHGLIDTALKYSLQAVQLARKCSHPNNSVLTRHTSITIEWSHISLLLYAFRYEDALKASQELGQSYDDDDRLESPEFMIHGLNCLLYVYLYNHLPGKSKEVAIRGLNLCQSEISKGKTYPHRSQLFLFRIGLVDALLDEGHVDEALNYLKEAEDGLSTVWPSVLDDFRYNVLVRKSQLLFANKDYSKSAVLIFKVLESDKKEVVTDKYILARLVKTLRFAGLVFCCNGEHERGIDSLSELEAIMQEYSILHPDCAHRAQFLLGTETKQGKWEVITRIARSALSCNHQDKILDNNLHLDHVLD